MGSLVFHPPDPEEAERLRRWLPGFAAYVGGALEIAGATPRGRSPVAREDGSGCPIPPPGVGPGSLRFTVRTAHYATGVLEPLWQCWRARREAGQPLPAAPPAPPALDPPVAATCEFRDGIRLQDDAAVLRLEGELSDDERVLRPAAHALRRWEGSGRPHLVLCLEGVPFIDSFAVTMLLQARRQARDRGGEVHLVGLQPGPRKKLGCYRVLSGFTEHPSVEAALAAIQGS